jgi:hypothetical protein
MSRLNSLFPASSNEIVEAGNVRAFLMRRVQRS